MQARRWGDSNLHKGSAGYAVHVDSVMDHEATLCSARMQQPRRRDV